MKRNIKIKLPERIPLEYVFPVLGFLFAVQMLEGTKVYTSAAYCAFIIVMVDAFNVSGGMIYPSGGYIFFCGFLTVILGGLAKVALGEPLDSNLIDGQKSMLVYLAGACSIWVAARINARVRRKKGLLAPLQIPPNRIEQVALGAAIFGQFGWMIVPTAYVSTFVQMNVFPALALFLFAYGKARETDGYRTFTVLSFVIWAWSTTVWGILGFSKEGMFRPSQAWALGALIAGYRLTWTRALMIGGTAIVAASLLTPIAQMGRMYRGETNASEMAWDLLSHPLRTREQYQQKVESVLGRNGYHWFDHNQGLLDRLTVLPIDDALIHLTDQGHSPGLFPIGTYVLNMIPRYLVKDKPVWHWGNRYAHEIGLLGKDDDTTGVSFSPFGEGYHCAQWWGVTAISMPIYLMMFVFCDSLTGSTRDSVWASIYVLLFGHSAAEGVLGTPFAAISTYAFMIIFAAFLSRYFLPLVGGLMLPPSKQRGTPVNENHWRPAPAYPLRPVPRTIKE
ncbi:hypothetical protein [Terriglobus sp. RCC_193]|uniref:hypothetical protein n=1 Tax=Terriglobus sp. RCC_193 TaxID=3239218 RepID=UPI003524EC70